MAVESDGNEVAGSALSIEAFERLVDAFGSSSSRWPGDRRSAAEALLNAGNTEALRAHRIVAQANALERLLNLMPKSDPVRLSVLTDRIAAAVEGEAVAQPGYQKAPVIDLISLRHKRTAADVAPVGRSGWAAALLAASLLLGVFVGSGADTAPTVQAAADAVGLGRYVDQLALSATDDPGQLQDEDVL